MLAKTTPTRGLCGAEAGEQLWAALQALQSDAAARKLDAVDRNARSYHLSRGHANAASQQRRGASGTAAGAGSGCTQAVGFQDIYVYIYSECQVDLCT